MEKKPYHHGNLEEALIEAGLALVAREGLTGMSLRRVAADCGVSHAAPYKHFAGKAELLAAMQRHVQDRFAQALESAYSQSARDPLIEMARTYLRFFVEHPHYFSFFQGGLGEARVDLNNMEAESGYRPFEVFKRAALRDLEPLGLSEAQRSQTVTAMWAVVHGVTSISMMSGVVYRGDWADLLEGIVTNNMGARWNRDE